MNQFDAMRCESLTLQSHFAASGESSPKMFDNSPFAKIFITQLHVDANTHRSSPESGRFAQLATFNPRKAQEIVEKSHCFCGFTTLRSTRGFGGRAPKQLVTLDSQVVVFPPGWVRFVVLLHGSVPMSLGEVDQKVRELKTAGHLFTRGNETCCGESCSYFYSQT